jgi:uncharacterized protein YecT (DUF1311 family)
MRLGVLLLVLSCCDGSAALAQGDKPDAKLSAQIQDCIKTKTGANWESCVGIASGPCQNNSKGATSELTACSAREQAVWDDILNETFRRLRDKLEKDQQDKLRDMQRAWIVSRDKTCAFYWDFFQGTMASPMSAECMNRETGRRALFLLGFLNDLPDK